MASVSPVMSVLSCQYVRRKAESTEGRRVQQIHAIYLVGVISGHHFEDFRLAAVPQREWHQPGD